MVNNHKVIHNDNNFTVNNVVPAKPTPTPSPKPVQTPASRQGHGPLFAAIALAATKAGLSTPDSTTPIWLIVIPASVWVLTEIVFNVLMRRRKTR